MPETLRKLRLFRPTVRGIFTVTYLLRCPGLSGYPRWIYTGVGANLKMVLDKVKTDDLMPTLDAVRSKLDQPLPLGVAPLICY